MELLRVVRITAAGLLGVLLAGCVHYRAQPIEAQATFEAFEARRLDAPEIRDFMESQAGIDRWPPPAWNLRSLSLAALFYSPDLDVARARWGVTQAGTVTAGARPNPSLTPSLGYNSTSRVITPWIPEVVLSLPIETAGKRGIRISRARELSEAARLEVLSTGWAVRDSVRRAYVRVYRTTRMATLLDRLYELQLQNLEMLEAQLEFGEISANELTQARIAAARTQLSLLQATGEKARERVRLAEAIGVPAAALDGIELSFADLEHLTTVLPTKEARLRAVTHRADILSSLSEYQASQAALRLEVARQYPDLDIGAGYQLDQTDSKWTLGINLVLPVFNRNTGPIAEAEASRNEAAARFLALQARVLAEVDGAAAAYRAAVETVEATDEMLAKLEQREATVSTTYKLGEISKLDLVNSEIEIAAGRVARLEALASAQLAAADLEHALQATLEPEAWVLVPPVRAGNEVESDDES